ncbi:MAG: hypothetical protein RDU25_01230 [Patescibacteria group bacterium]|nr:hypothetical protein [Patescibacteria group bacterium]
MDSLRPHSVDSSLPTLPPKKRQPRFLLFNSFVVLFVSTLLAGLAIYGIYIRPTLGENAENVNLAVGLLVISQCTLLILLLMVLDIVKDEKKSR